ncbi:hypothetical protein GCM10009610_65820 [Pseudonocardia xinjiangensis]
MRGCKLDSDVKHGAVTPGTIRRKQRVEHEEQIPYDVVRRSGVCDVAGPNVTAVTILLAWRSVGWWEPGRA